MADPGGDYQGGGPALVTLDQPCVVLSMKVSDNAYGDTQDTYVFPTRYLSAFAPLMNGIPVMALIYEPRGDRRDGRMAYVAWTRITQPPELIDPRSDKRLFRVVYDGKLMPLPRAVSQVENDWVFESFLRQVPKAEIGLSQRGLAVRPISFEDYCSVLAASGLMDISVVGSTLEHAERRRISMERLVRDRGFGLQVLSAYSWRCAVTGWSSPPALSHGLLEAAHLVSVANGGRDEVRNGLALTPTVHSLFDAGALEFAYQDGLWRLCRTEALECMTLQTTVGSLTLEEGQPLLMPEDHRLWPLPGRFARGVRL